MGGHSGEGARLKIYSGEEKNSGRMRIIFIRLGNVNVKRKEKHDLEGDGGKTVLWGKECLEDRKMEKINPARTLGSKSTRRRTREGEEKRDLISLLGKNLRGRTPTVPTLENSILKGKKGKKKKKERIKTLPLYLRKAL